MAILTGKQRKALDTGEFGLPDERKFPLTDQNHVRKAIQFFKYCPPEKRKTLARNINRKAKEYGMKINAKGEFAKYISKDVYKSESSDVLMDAYNVGTISPIVAGTSTLTKTIGPDVLLEDEEDKTVAEALFGSVEVEYRGQGEPIAHFVPYKSYSDMERSRRDHSGKPTINSIVVDMIHDGELLSAIDYTCNTYENRESVDLTRKDIIAIAMDDKLDHDEKRKKIAYLFTRARTTSEMRFYISTLYAIDKKLCADSIYDFRAMTLTNNGKTPIFPHYHSLVNQLLPQKAPNIMNAPTNIIQDLSNTTKVMKDYTELERRLKAAAMNGTDLQPFYAPQALKVLLPMLKHMVEIKTIKWYFTETVDKNYYIFFETYNDEHYNRSVCRAIPIMNCKTYAVSFLTYEIGYFPRNGVDMQEGKGFQMFAHLLEMMHKNEGIPDFKIINPYEFTHHHAVSEGRLVSKMVSRAMDIVKGIRVSKDGDVKMNLQNKLTFEHYEEIHRVLKENEKNKNYDAMKENLAYIFALIGTIEKIYMNEQKGNGKTYLPEDSEYQEMVRLRALLISDFKVYLRVVMKHDRNFDFLKYYNESEVNKSVFVVHGKDVQYMARLLRTILVN